MNMPKKDGLDVLTEGREISPSTKFVMCSAAMDTMLAEILEQYSSLPLAKSLMYKSSGHVRNYLLQPLKSQQRS
jgi:YesN/AraC family two-component response regulator